MTEDPEVFHFIREHIRSVWTLELLLKLKTDPERCWSASELVEAMRASHALVDGNLQVLMTAGLVLEDDQGCFRYHPAVTALSVLCDELEQTYRIRPVTVIRWISAPVERLKSLADAFKFKVKGGDE